MMGGAFSCMLSAAGFGYTCTGGSFDLNQFDTVRCLEWPENNSNTNTGGVVGGGGGGGGGGTYTPPSSIPTSGDFLKCVGSIFPNETKTCFDKSTSSAGLRWTWATTDEADECKSKVSKYRIDISSSDTNHGVIRRYTVSGGSANSFRFKNCPTSFLDGTNVKFVLSPLTAQDELLITPVETELDTNSAGESCEDIGAGNLVSAIDFKSLTLVVQAATPPPPATDCTGGTWGDWGACIKDGSLVTACGNYGMKTRYLTGYTPAAHGGTCVTEQSESCYTGACPSATPPPPPQDCVLSGWFDFTPDGQRICSKTCGGGVKTQKRVVEISAAYGGTCPTTTQQVACNTHACPVDCQGTWELGSQYTKSVPAEKGTTNCEYRDDTYRVTRPAVGTGAACPYTDGARRTDKITSTARGCQSKGGFPKDNWTWP